MKLSSFPRLWHLDILYQFCGTLVSFATRYKWGLIVSDGPYHENARFAAHLQANVPVVKHHWSLLDVGWNT
jgi:hypothetical protein